MMSLPSRCSRGIIGAMQRMPSRGIVASATTFRDFRRTLATKPENAKPQQKRGGGFLIAFGWTLLGLLAVDQYLQYRQAEKRTERIKMLEQMQNEADEFNKVNWDLNLPTLFRCSVTMTDMSLDGVKILRGVRVGDVVEVMEENTGPHNAYHLCRVMDEKDGSIQSVGWYPVDFLKRI